MHIYYVGHIYLFIIYVAYEVEIIGTIRPINNLIPNSGQGIIPNSGQGIILGGVKQIDS